MQGVIPAQVRNFAFLSTGLHEVSTATILMSLRCLSVEDVICCVSCHNFASANDMLRVHVCVIWVVVEAYGPQDQPLGHTIYY